MSAHKAGGTDASVEDAIANLCAQHSEVRINGVRALKCPHTVLPSTVHCCLAVLGQCDAPTHSKHPLHLLAGCTIFLGGSGTWLTILLCFACSVLFGVQTVVPGGAK
jgi:hypothetical protein